MGDPKLIASVLGQVLLFSRALTCTVRTLLYDQMYCFVVNAGERLEKRIFHSLFACKDQKIGMTAFLEKKQPEWTDS